MSALHQDLLGHWNTNVVADPSIPAVSVTYEFRPENILVIHADGVPPAEGGYELVETFTPPRLNMIIPVSMAPLALVALVDLAEPDALRLRFIDQDEVTDFLPDVDSSTEQLRFARAQGPPSPLVVPTLQEPYASMPLEERKRGAVQEYLAQSMQTGMQALQSPDGLGGALHSMISSGQETLPSVAASRYFHSALQMGGHHVNLLHKYGFSHTDIAQLLEEPDAKEAAQEAVMQQMAAMFGGDMGALTQLFQGMSAFGEEGNEEALQQMLAGGGPPQQPGQSPDLAQLLAQAGGNQPSNPYAALGDGTSPFGLASDVAASPFTGLGAIGAGGFGSRVDGMDDGDQDGQQPQQPPSGCNPQ